MVVDQQVCMGLQSTKGRKHVRKKDEDESKNKIEELEEKVEALENKIANIMDVLQMQDEFDVEEMMTKISKTTIEINLLLPSIFLGRG